MRPRACLRFAILMRGRSANREENAILGEVTDWTGLRENQRDSLKDAQRAECNDDGGNPERHHQNAV